MMKINFSYCLWNFTNYADLLPLQDVAAYARKQNCGLEIWPYYGKWSDLFEPTIIKEVKPLFEGIELSLHTRTAQNTLDQHKKQIDAAVLFGAEILVLHPDDYYLPDTRQANPDLIQRSLEYARAVGVRLALENGQLGFLKDVHDQFDEIEFCLDFGHVYLVPQTIQNFFEEIGDRIIHLHLHDSLFQYKDQKNLPSWQFIDHHIPGTGIIPEEDWRFLFEKLDEKDYQGSAVLELRPYHPFQALALGIDNLSAKMDWLSQKNQEKEN